MTAEEWVRQMPLHWLPLPREGVLDVLAQGDEIVRTMKVAVAEEREACARVADVAYGRQDCDPHTATWIRSTILARGKS